MKIQDVAEATSDKGNSRIPTLSQQGVNTNVLIGANPDGSTNYTVSVNPELVNLTSAEFGLDTDPKRSIVNTEKSQFFDGDVNTAVRANGVKLENTNNLDVAEYTMDGMMADSNGKHVRFGTQGIDAGDQVISGVKAGVADSDVVTVKQLKDSISNVGVSLGGHNMVNAGITHKFGYSPEKKNIPDRYKGGPISSIYIMQDEMTRMQAKNDAQQVELEQQRAEIESLKSMVQQLLAKY